MRLPSFNYLQPRTVPEACALLAQPGAKAMAGGTDLLVKLKQGTLTAQTIVSLQSIPQLDVIQPGTDGELVIGALATLHAVANSPLVQERCALLATAAGCVGRPRLPYMGTLGGNLCLEGRCFYYNQSTLRKQPVAPCYKNGGDRCHVAKGSDHCNALFVADTAPTLVALGAEVTIASADGETRLPLADFYPGTGEPVNVLAAGQMLTQVRVPARPAHGAGVYLRHSPRQAIDFAVVSAAVVLQFDPADGACAEARIVLGSVAPSPLRTTEAEAVLVGRHRDDDAARAAAVAAAKQARPLGHLGFSSTYKRALIQALVTRAVMQAECEAASSTAITKRGAS
jgi:4-hydroxybenzoyl-CoA reductase subunit beta